MATTAEYQRAYRQTESGKAVAKRYAQSEKGKAVFKKYRGSGKGRISQKRGREVYRSTIKGFLSGTFTHINARCNDLQHPSYKNYGGRGIRVRFESLDDFRGYVTNELCVDPRGLQIDRIDNDGDYERGNIRFITHRENQQNKRPCDGQAEETEEAWENEYDGAAGDC